nr:unnamed protein product [Spirometra erinaceieuropaei]
MPHRLYFLLPFFSTLPIPPSPSRPSSSSSSSSSSSFFSSFSSPFPSPHPTRTPPPFSPLSPFSTLYSTLFPHGLDSGIRLVRESSLFRESSAYPCEGLGIKVP